MKCPIFFALPKENRIALTLFPKALPLKILHSQNQKGHPNFIFCPQVHIVIEIIPPPPAQNSGRCAGGSSKLGEALLKQMLQMLIESGFVKYLLRPIVQELCDQVLIVALGYLDLVLWLAQRTIRSPSKGETFDYFWLQK